MKCDHARAFASSTLVEGEIVWCCRDCRHLRLDGTPRWIVGGSGSIDQLRRMAAARDADRRRDDDFRDSDIDDVRWTRL